MWKVLQEETVNAIVLYLLVTGQSEKPVAILALVFSTMHTIWTV